MRRYRIVHRTYYNFAAPVQLGPHALRLRPREGHDLRIESSKLEITPRATLYWQRDAEGNSVATAVFAEPADRLAIESDLIVQQYATEGATAPCAGVFGDADEDRAVLAPYFAGAPGAADAQLAAWLPEQPPCSDARPTHAALERLCQRIHQDLRYKLREQPGVQSVEETLRSGSGACRDLAQLFIRAARLWGLAARFVSGYLHAPPMPDHFGATHAWAEVYLPGRGWCGFDPTLGHASGTDHFAVSVARLAESVPPVAGSIIGPGGTMMDVGVWVTAL